MGLLRMHIFNATILFQTFSYLILYASFLASQDIKRLLLIIKQEVKKGTRFITFVVWLIKKSPLIKGKSVYNIKYFKQNALLFLKQRNKIIKHILYLHYLKSFIFIFGVMLGGLFIYTSTFLIIMQKYTIFILTKINVTLRKSLSINRHNSIVFFSPKNYTAFLKSRKNIKM